MERCPKARADCPRRLSKRGCTVVQHHIWFPESAYKTKLEVEFRELWTNRVPMCAQEEHELHLLDQPPPKPTKEVMRYCVEAERTHRELAVRPLGRP